MGRWLGAAAGLAGGLLLIGVLVWLVDLDLAEVADRLAALPGWVWLLVVALTFAQIALSALKWRLVLASMEPQLARVITFPFALFYSSLAAVLAQVLTVHAASMLTRSAATRLHYSLPVLRGATTSALEQVFDLAALLIGLGATLAALAAGAGVGGWVIAGLGALLLVHALTPLAVRRGLRLVGTLGRLSGRLAPLAPIGALAGAEPRGVIRLLRRLTLLSGLRYAAMLLRALLVAAAAFAVSGEAVVHGFAFVQASQILSLAPGNLGIAESGWSGTLYAFGHPLATGVALGLTVRVASYAGFLAVFAVSGLVFAAHRIRVAGGVAPR